MKFKNFDSPSPNTHESTVVNIDPCFKIHASIVNRKTRNMHIRFKWNKSRRFPNVIPFLFSSTNLSSHEAAGVAQSVRA